MLLQILVFLGSFITIWFGAGLIVSSVSTFSRKLGISSFAFSFFILGILTSTPEFAVGLTAVTQNDPGIFVGNLVGGIPVLFLLIIPLLAIVGNRIILKGQISTRNLLLAFGVILLPTIFVSNHTVTATEGFLMIIAYTILLILIQRNNGFLSNKNSDVIHKKSYSLQDLFKIVYGVGLVFVASHYIVQGTMYFADFFSVPSIYLSLILLALGTNLPELSVAARAVLSGKKDIAFGNYVGSAATNTLLFGIFTVIGSGNVLVEESFLPTLIILTLGLALVFYFTRSKNDISRKEGWVLLCFYGIFLVVEMF